MIIEYVILTAMPRQICAGWLPTLVSLRVWRLWSQAVAVMSWASGTAYDSSGR